MEKKNKPAIRFKGFREDWENEKLFNLASFSKGNGYSKSDLTDTGHPILLYGSLYTNYRTTIKNVETYVNAKSENVLTKGGEVVVPASGETQEDIVRASVVEMENIILGGDLNIIIPNDELDATFLALTISNGNVYKELVKKAQGKSVVHIRNSDLQEALIPYPNRNEQQKIGNFFENIDQLITQHQQKHSKLQALKKAMLGKMFPKQGQTIPEIRFKGFVGDWEEREFGRIFKYERPDNYIVSSDEYSDEFETPVLTANKAFILGYTNETRTFKELCIIFDDFTLDSKYVDFPFMVKSSALKILTIENKITDNLKFAFYNLSIKKIEIMGHARHYISVVQKTIVRVPDIIEQQKIGNYFKNLDSLINNHETQITKLQNIKKALLAKMFI